MIDNITRQRIDRELLAATTDPAVLSAIRRRMAAREGVISHQSRMIESSTAVEPRSSTIQVRVTGSERAALQAAADAMGCTIATYIRGRVKDTLG